MSYSDERDELAELFGVNTPRRKTGYSDELEESAEPAPPTLTSRAAEAAPDTSPAKTEIKTPVKLRPPAHVEPHPLDLPPVRPLPASVSPREPATAPPAIEDEEFLHLDTGDAPDFSDLDFIAPEKSSAVKGQSEPAPATKPTPPEPLAEKQELLQPRPPMSPPAGSRAGSPDVPDVARPATDKSDLHFESDATLARSAKDQYLLDTQGLVKIYDGRTVVNGVDINVRSGEIVGLLGPNGAGKTTSFYMIVGLVPPNSGRVLFNGNEVTTTPMYQRARLGMGYLPQEESIFRKLTVEENIMAVMETLDIPRQEQRSRCEELLERFSITHIRKNVALTCSGGEKRRLTIARSLVTMPSLLMLDEPFSGVDPIAVNEIQNIVEDLRKSGLAILITDHNARQTLELVDRAYLIYEGKVLREGTRDFLINDPVSRELYLGDRFTM